MDAPSTYHSTCPVLGGKSCRGIVFSWLRSTKTVSSSSTRIVVGLKSDNSSREMLLRLLHSIVVPGDNVLAVHVQHSDNAFDPNTFHIHEDLCKSKQVDFEVKVCNGSCYITELSHQVRITFATVLAVGCKTTCPDISFIAECLKALPPTCKLLIVDNMGKPLFQKMGTSQQGTSSQGWRPLKPSLSESSSGTCDQAGTRRLPFRKFSSMPSSSSSQPQTEATEASSPKYSQQLHNVSPKLFTRKITTLEAERNYRRFSIEELYRATNNFGPDMLIGEGADSQVYKAIFENNQAAAVKVLKNSEGPESEDRLFREVEILSGLKHKNIVQILGYCHCKELCAIAYDLVSSSLKQRLNQLNWSERMQVALGVAKGLEYLHSCYPPIIHKAITSSNILLSEDGKSQLADFGAARVYLAPEYIKYGKLDEKIDVYSYGLVLLELITGKEDIPETSVSNQESLVVWARSLLNCSQYEHMIDPNLNGDYKKDEIETMLTAARLCLLHSCTRRPTMKMMIQFLEEPRSMSEMQKKREGLLEQKNWIQR